MRQTVWSLVAVAAVVVVFAAGYATRMLTESNEARVQAQTSQETPGKARDGGSGKVTLSGIVQSVQGTTITLRVEQSRVQSIQSGATVTVDVGQKAEIFREIRAADLRPGERVTLAGAADGGKFVADRVFVGGSR
jgi:hypothetical protein